MTVDSAAEETLQGTLLLLLQDPQHLVKKGGWHKNKPKKTKEIQEVEEPVEEQLKQKNEEDLLEDVKPEN